MFGSHLWSWLSSGLALPHTLPPLVMVHESSYLTASQHTKVQMTPDPAMVEGVPILWDHQD